MNAERQQSRFSDLTFEQAILDSLPANIAVLSADGEILAVNSRWHEFAAANLMMDPSVGIGINYLDVCRTACADPNARAALDGILDVIDGKSDSFYHEYPCHSPWQERWFALRVTPLVDHPNCVVVSHEDITDRATGSD